MFFLMVWFKIYGYVLDGRENENEFLKVIVLRTFEENLFLTVGILLKSFIWKLINRIHIKKNSTTGLRRQKKKNNEATGINF